MAEGTTITLGNLSVDPDRYLVSVSGRVVAVTFLEFEILVRLVQHAGRVVQRDQLLQEIWGDGGLSNPLRLTIHMSRLRKKLAGSSPWTIQTVRRRGYVLADTTAATYPRAV